ncbi:unnamed protein product [Blepharisma stoltei]|uniref:CCHC-type domain-containing protein n=1 Tax=Blepharisma stoltei TaxID=1481888 RepID=A0AAU9JBG6_9CILI|nr:unnamed protein product [Blepharisma stoltei]
MDLVQQFSKPTQSISFQYLAQKINLLNDNIEKQGQKITSLIKHVENQEKFQTDSIEKLFQNLNTPDAQEARKLPNPNQSPDIDSIKEFVPRGTLAYPVLPKTLELNTTNMKYCEKSATKIIESAREIHDEIFKNLNAYFRSKCQRYCEFRDLRNYKFSLYNLIMIRTLKWCGVAKENWFDICKRKEFIQSCIYNPILLEIGDYLVRFNKEVEICKIKLQNYVQKKESFETGYLDKIDRKCSFCGLQGHLKKDCKEIKQAFCLNCLDYNEHTTKYHAIYITLKN